MLAQELGRTAYDVSRMGKEALGYQMAACHRGASARIVAQRIEEPVAVMVTVVPQIASVLASAHHVVHPTFHAIVLLFKHADVAEGHVVIPRNDGGRIRPTGSCRTIITMIGVGNDSRHSTISPLIGSQVCQPFVEEVVHSSQERSCAEEHLCVARPSQTLVTLRAIGRHIHKVVPESPFDVVLKLVDDRIRRTELPNSIKTRADRYGFEIFQTEFAFQAFHADVSEAIEGMARLEALLSFPVENEQAGSLGGTHVRGVEITVLIQHFGMGNAYLVALLARKLHTLPSHDVLPEVDDLLPFRCNDDFLCRNRLIRLHRFANRCYQMVLRHIHHLGLPAPYRLRLDACPRRIHQACINGFTIIDIGKSDTASLGGFLLCRHTTFPFAVREDASLRAIRIFNVDLHQQGNVLPILVSVLRVAGIHPTAIPTRRNGCRNHVLPFLKQGSHIISLILKTFEVGCPSRSEFVIPYPLTIDERFINAVRSDVCRCFPDVPRKVLGLTEISRNRSFRGRYPLSFPIISTDARLPFRSGFLRSASMVVPYLQGPSVFCIGSECTFIGHGYGIV